MWLARAFFYLAQRSFQHAHRGNSIRPLRGDAAFDVPQLIGRFIDHDISIKGADVKIIGKSGIHLLHGGTKGVERGAEFVIARHLSRLVAFGKRHNQGAFDC